MSKDSESGESQFGFKNKEKAEETIKILAEHDIQYQKLTVRGLLGRAKRVLKSKYDAYKSTISHNEANYVWKQFYFFICDSVTKAEEKINNIQAAIEVFESWIEENAGSTSSKSTKSADDDKIETVPGLGFKDKEAALKTLK